MHDAEILVPILISLGFFAMVFGIVYMYRRENLAMVEKGMDPKKYRPKAYVSLKYGLLLVGAGAGLALAYLITQYLLHDDENPALWFAFIAIGGGLGLINSYRIEKKELLDKKQPGIYNQAIMDFGAVICKPVAPLCAECVFKKKCYAFLNDKINFSEILAIK